MGRIARSWTLAKLSVRVVFENKNLLLFPVVAMLATLGLIAVILAPWLVTAAMNPSKAANCIDRLTGAGKPYVSIFVDWGGASANADPASHPSGLAEVALRNTGVERHGTVEDDEKLVVRIKPLGYVATGVLYLVSMFLGVFFNVAFYHEVMKALAGQPVSICAGLRFACTRTKAILMWSLLASTVGLLLMALEERIGWLGKWLVRLLGVGWSIASVFVVPALVREKDVSNPVALLKSSGRTLSRTWGESIAGYVGLNLVACFGLLLTLGFAAVGISLGFALSAHVWVVVVSTCCLWVLSLIVVVYLTHIASQVYKCALYLYAIEGAVPGPFTQQHMDMAWKIRTTE